ncbi:MAG: L-carnitine dehydratase/bile acid-inducible protein F, partial [uncultured Acetobacteraceae bacterium]
GPSPQRPAAGPPRARPDARARRAHLHPDAGRPRRRGHQDRAPRGRRRHPRLRAALRAEHARERLLRGRQPQQEVGHARHRQTGGAGDRPPPARELRRAGGELQGRRAGEVRLGLGAALAEAPAPDLLLHHRLRPDRPLRAAPRLRQPHPRDGRHHVLDRRAGRAAAESGRAGGRPLRRSLRLHRPPRRAEPPQRDRAGSAHRHRDAGHAPRLVGEPGHELSRNWRESAAARQPAPEHCALPSVPHRRRLHGAERRQRPDLRALLQGVRPGATALRPALRHQRQARGEPATGDGHADAADADPHHDGVGGEAGSAQDRLRPDQHPGAGLRRPARPGARLRGGDAARERGDGEGHRQPRAPVRHAAGLQQRAAAAWPAHGGGAGRGARHGRGGDRGVEGEGDHL